jgi:hypothetical protein
MLPEREDEIQTQYGFLGGFGLWIDENLKFDINGGLFQRGRNPNSEVLGQMVYASGGSIRILYSLRYPPEISRDLRLYRKDPRTEIMKLPGPPTAVKQMGLLMSSEFTYIGQNLQDPDNPSSSKLFNAMAGDFALRLKFNTFRLYLDFVMRNLEFLLFSVPGFEAYRAFHEKTKTTPEYFLSVGCDYHVQTLSTTFGFLLGLKHPATYHGDPDVPEIVVVKDREDFAGFVTQYTKNKVILPPNVKPSKIIAYKMMARCYLSSFLTFQAEITIHIDRNESMTDEHGYRVLRERTFTDKVGFALIAQANF